MLTEKTFDAGVVKLNYVEGPPNGRPLILLHGSTVRWQTFSTLLPLFSFRFHTYALDLRGHGLSGRTPGAYNTADFALDVERFVREQVGGPAALLGWSLGAHIAIQVAATLPNLVYAAVLEDPAAHLIARQNQDANPRPKPMRDRMRQMYDIIVRGPSRSELMAELAAINPNEDEVTRRRRAVHWSQLDPEVVEASFMNSTDTGFVPGNLLPKITCPVLLLYGEPALGGLLEPQDLEWYRTRVQDLTCVHIPGAGHVLHRPDPILYFQHVMDFLEAL